MIAEKQWLTKTMTSKHNSQAPFKVMTRRNVNIIIPFPQDTIPQSLLFCYQKQNILAVTADHWVSWVYSDIWLSVWLRTALFRLQRSVLIFTLLFCSILQLATMSLLHLLKCIWDQEMSLCVSGRKSKVLDKERWINQGWEEKERDGGRRQKKRCIDRKRRKKERMRCYSTGALCYNISQLKLISS